MFNKHDIKRNAFMLDGSFKKKSYDWWWHSFTGINEKTGEEKPFFIEFFIINPSLGKDYPVFGQLKENKENKIRPSYLMVKAGSWGKDKAQLHKFSGINNMNVSKKVPYSVSSGDFYLSETETHGEIDIKEEENKLHPEWMSDSGSMKWNLKMKKATAFNVGYGASSFFRLIKAFEMYWHAEGMKTFYSGEVIYNNERYIVNEESSYGYQDKNWGRGFTTPWLWLSSNNMYSNISNKKLQNSVFDIGGGKPKIYFVPLKRKLLGAFFYEGKEYEYNFSKFWAHVHTKFSFKEYDDYAEWNVEQSNRHSLMKTVVRCNLKDMLFVNYEDPEGLKRHTKLYNGGNGTGNIKLYLKKGKELTLIDDIDIKNVGCEYGEYDKNIWEKY